MTRIKGPTSILIAEHRRLRRCLSCLNEALKGELIGETGVYSPREAADFLKYEVNAHFLNEEKYLFPLLAEVPGMSEGPLKLMVFEHDEYRRLENQFQELAEAVRLGEANEARRRRFQEVGKALTVLLLEHIDREDHVILPLAEKSIAADLLTEAVENIRLSQDPFNLDEKVVILDMRRLPGRRRREKIIKTFAEIPPGGELKVINNKALNSLHRSLEDQCGGRYAWRDEEEGPRKWVAAIKKVA